MRKNILVLAVILLLNSFCITGEVSAASIDTENSLPQFEVGDGHAGIVKADGSLWLWGSAASGQMGYGNKNMTPFLLMDQVKYVAIGGAHSAAIKDDGSLWMWGSNEYGQIGNNNTGVNQRTPVKVMDQVVDVSLGEYHSAAVKADGTLWMWGSNQQGQLGDGTIIDSPIPKMIMEGVTDVSLGDRHSAAIKEDGSLWMWGTNRFKPLGDPEYYKEYCPTPMCVLTDVISVSLGAFHSGAIKKDHTLWMWGRTDNGQCAGARYTESGVPTMISEDAAAIELGGNTTAMIKLNGELWMWGNNENYQLGKHTYSNDVFTPELVMTNVQSVDIGEYTSMAIQKDGSFWLWGKQQSRDGGESVGTWEYPILFMTGQDVYRGATVAGFKDVGRFEWYAEAVKFVSDRKLMTGLDETMFGPTETLSRAQFAVILHRMNGAPKMDYEEKFPDIPEGEWYTDAVLWASEQGIVTGYESGYFGPANNITREQMGVMMYRYANAKDLDTSSRGDISRYSDVAAVSSYAYEALQWTDAKGIITGKSNGVILSPQGYASRAETAMIMMRFLQKYEL